MSEPTIETLEWHESAGARILVPTSYTITQPFPELAATAQGGLPALIVGIIANQELRTLAERTTRQVPRSIPPIEIDVLRNQSIDRPYRGYELVLEQRNTEYPIVN